MATQIAPLNKHARFEMEVIVMKSVIKDSAKRFSFISRIIFLYSFKEDKHAL